MVECIETERRFLRTDGLFGQVEQGSGQTRAEVVHLLGHKDRHNRHKIL
jgi:hypothetical protein